LEHAFGRAADFTIGIEEELLVVESGSYELAHESDRLLERMALDERSARHDLYEAQIELSSPICANAGEATQALSTLRATLREAGGTAIGAGLHPTGAFGDVRIVAAERYARERERLRGLVDRTPDCALHVHIGMPDPETAIKVCNGLRARLPLLEALAANSPYWHGRDSGFSSARRILRRGFPRVEIPGEMRDFAHYEELVGAAMKAADVDDYTFVWWEVRPHPRLGTVEVRAMDSQAPLRTVAGLGALVQALAKHLAENSPPTGVLREVIAEASFRAGRDGVEAVLPDGDRFRPVQDIVNDLLDLIGPHAAELGSDGPLEEVERLVREGGGADRQRAAHREGGIAAVLERLVGETAEPYE
jgi:glutamate---cysteine ligase / carboxylate-amine ligase